MPRGHPDFTKPIAIIAQTLGVKLLPDWAAIQAEDVDIVATKIAESGIWTTILSYKVPAGNTLLVYDWSVVLPAEDGQVVGDLYNATTHYTLGLGGGLKGFQFSLTKPKRIPAEQTIEVTAIQVSGVAQTISAHIGGALI